MITRALLVASMLAFATPAAAQTCSGDGRSCRVDTEQDLKCAARDPQVEEIMLTADIVVTAAEVDCGGVPYTGGSVEILGHEDGSLRNMEIRSEVPGFFEISTTESAEGLFKCWPESPVTVELSDVIVDGGGIMGALLSRQQECTMTLDSVHALNFNPGGSSLMSVEGDMHLTIHRSRFENIGGSVIHAAGGLVSVTQSVFSNCGGHTGGGALSLESVVEATVTGCLFWGCWSTDGGGAISAEGSVSLLVEGSAFVGNAAPLGGALLWESAGPLGMLHSVFAANAATDSWIAGPLTVAGMPDSACNFQWIDDPANGGDGNGSLTEELVLPSAPTQALGNGGAIAFNTAGSEPQVLKTLFLENRAGAGGAIAALQTTEDRRGEGPGMGDASWKATLVHNSFVSNQADDGAALWMGEDESAYLVAVGNLWLDHDADPLSVHEEECYVVLAGNHVDGPPLSTGVGVPVWDFEETCGARPAMQVCEEGCSAAANEDLCGEVFDDVAEQWGYPTGLHFGRELCPVEDDGPCAPLGEDGCETLDGPCVWQAAIDDSYFEMADGRGDRGVTGLPCALTWTWLADSDEDHVPDFAECDVDGEPLASEDGARNPFADELCNGLDDNCDGAVDEGLDREMFEDLDGDGHGAGDPILTCDPDGELASTAGDCDDGDAEVHPAATEVCNGVDDDCDGEVDEGLAQEGYMDLDGDGHGGGELVLVCDSSVNLVLEGGDCDDSDATVHPSATETHDDGVDNDCDGVVDLDAPGCHSAGCLATRVAPGEDGLELSFAPVAPGLLLTGLWGVGRRLRRR